MRKKEKVFNLLFFFTFLYLHNFFAMQDKKTLYEYQVSSLKLLPFTTYIQQQKKENPDELFYLPIRSTLKPTNTFSFNAIHDILSEMIRFDGKNVYTNTFENFLYNYYKNNLKIKCYKKTYQHYYKQLWFWRILTCAFGITAFILYKKPVTCPHINKVQVNSLVNFFKK